MLIGAAKVLADPTLVPGGTVAPKAADAKGWLDLCLASTAAGGSRRELRALVPVAWDLAQKVTHGNIDRVDAYASAQATVLVVRVLQQLAS